MPPVSINVSIPGDPKKWPREYRQSDNLIIVPCIRESKPDTVRIIDGTSILSIPTYNLRCSLAFARTYHKMQGCTKELVILDLSLPVLLPMFLVGITRVKLGEHLRVLFPYNWQDVITRLKKLTRSKNLVLWLSSYDNTGKWSPKPI